MDPRQAEIVRSLYKMAWIDGHISDREVWILSRLMAGMNIPLAQRLAVGDQMLHEPDLGEVRLEEVLPDRASRLLATELLITVCLSDDTVDPAEMELLKELATRMEIPFEELDRLRARSMQTLAEQ